MRRSLSVWGLLVAFAGLSGCSAIPRGPSPHPFPAGTAGGLSLVRPAATHPGPSGAPTPTGALGPVILEPDDGMAPIDDFLRGARSTLTMTMYELADATVERILAGDAARGVAVRVLLDSALEGARNQRARAYLTSHGVSVAFAPFSRVSHQKTICVDNRSCLVMSLNLVATDYRSTRDVAVTDDDPADVGAIAWTFAADFVGGSASAAATPAGDHLLWSPGSGPAIVGVIDDARRTLWIENEEMASDAVTAALVAAARRGVDVEVCMTADSSAQAALDRIVAAGGHVHLYPNRDGVLYIHEKLVLADAGTPIARAAVGSINFSPRSLDDNRELDVILGAPTATGQIATLGATFRRDFAGAPTL